jgi:hypothetical protein
MNSAEQIINEGGSKWPRAQTVRATQNTYIKAYNDKVQPFVLTRKKSVSADSKIHRPPYHSTLIPGARKQKEGSQG